MRSFAAVLLFAASGILWPPSSVAQDAEVRIGLPPLPAAGSLVDARWERADSSFAGGLIARIPPSLFSADAARSAREAAALDPGILVFPDPPIDAKIVRLRPRGDVDPKMILPRERERTGSSRPRR